MERAESPDPEILAGLKKVVAAGGAMLMQASKGRGIFVAGAKGKTLADRAVAAGLLKLQAEGKAKSEALGVITERGLLKLAEVESPRDALNALLPLVERIGKAAEAPSTEGFRVAIEAATNRCVEAISRGFQSALEAATKKCEEVARKAFDGLQGAVLRAVAPNTPQIDPSPVLHAIRAALTKVEPVAVERLASARTGTPYPAPKPPPLVAPGALSTEVVAFVESVARERTVGCDFVELFEHLRKRHPDLTIGGFHDALRALDAARRVRLKDWPRMLDEMPRPELALFVSHTVMYHVQPAH
jgi:hypothetical protein